MHAEKLSFKKSVVAGECHRPRRGAGGVSNGQSIISRPREPERLIFHRRDLDQDLPCGDWATRGQRLTAKVPHGRWKDHALAAALRHDRIDALWFVEGPIDGESFRTACSRDSRPMAPALWTRPLRQF